MSRMRMFGFVLGVGLCVLAGSTEGHEVPFRRVIVDPDLSGDGKAIGDVDILSTGWDDDHWRFVRLWRNDAIRAD